MLLGDYYRSIKNGTTGPLSTNSKREDIYSFVSFRERIRNAPRSGTSDLPNSVLAVIRISPLLDFTVGFAVGARLHIDDLPFDVHQDAQTLALSSDSWTGIDSIDVGICSCS